jgi:hypothetical protein
MINILKYDRCKKNKVKVKNINLKNGKRWVFVVRVPKKQVKVKSSML